MAAVSDGGSPLGPLGGQGSAEQWGSPAMTEATFEDTMVSVSLAWVQYIVVEKPPSRPVVSRSRRPRVRRPRERLTVCRSWRSPARGWPPLAAPVFFGPRVDCGAAVVVAFCASVTWVSACFSGIWQAAAEAVGAARWSAQRGGLTTPGTRESGGGAAASGGAYSAGCTEVSSSDAEVEAAGGSPDKQKTNGPGSNAVECGTEVAGKRLAKKKTRTAVGGDGIFVDDSVHASQPDAPMPSAAEKNGPNGAHGAAPPGREKGDVGARRGPFFRKQARGQGRRERATSLCVRRQDQNNFERVDAVFCARPRCGA